MNHANCVLFIFIFIFYIIIIIIIIIILHKITNYLFFINQINILYKKFHQYFALLKLEKENTKQNQ